MNYKDRLEKAAMVNALVDEITKIAQEQDKKSKPPGWLSDAVDIGSFIGGAAVGTYTGDIVADKLIKIKSPVAKNLARYVGAGLAGYATMKVLPVLRKAAPEKIKEIMGVKDE